MYYIHTYIHTDRQTDIHTYIHIYIRYINVYNIHTYIHDACMHTYTHRNAHFRQANTHTQNGNAAVDDHTEKSFPCKYKYI